MIFPSIFALIMGNICIEWGEVQSVGQMDPIINESSGLVMLADGSLLTHNDSGDGPVLYRISQSGVLLQTVELDGAVAVDWESLTSGPCGEETCVFVADVGDNGAARQSVTIFRFPVQALLTEQSATVIVDSTSQEVIYPDGPRDCETIAVDPMTETLVFIEKIPKGEARWYTLKPEAWGGAEPAELAYGGLMDTGADSFTGGWMTGGDFDPSGTILWTRTYPQGFGWSVRRGEDREIEALDYLLDFEIPINEQCESLTVSPDGEKLWLSCEGRNGVLASAECALFAEGQGYPETDDGGGSSNRGCAAGTASLWLLLLTFSLVLRNPRTL